MPSQGFIRSGLTSPRRWRPSTPPLAGTIITDCQWVSVPLLKFSRRQCHSTWKMWKGVLWPMMILLCGQRLKKSTTPGWMLHWGAWKTGLGLNYEECLFKMTQMPYMGDFITREGIKSDPEKVQVIKAMPVPSDVMELQRALGLAKYMGKLIPNLSYRTSVLRALLVQDAEWQWQPEHEAAWVDLKAVLVAGPVLQHFDDNQAVCLSCNASKDGLGAAPLQQRDGVWMPVAYASRVMTRIELRPNRKTTAKSKKDVTSHFYLWKFDCYVNGREFVVEADHKSLIATSRKPLCDAPPRLQRLLLRVQKYDLTLEYGPGKQLDIADTLSQAFSCNTASSSTEAEVDVHACCMKSSIPVSKRWQLIAKESPGWGPQGSHQRRPRREPSMSMPYATFVDSVMDGVLLKGQCIVMPSSRRPEMLQLLHEGHLRMEKCKRRARDIMY